MTIEDLNKFCSIVREYNNQPVPYEELAQKCAKEGLTDTLLFLFNNHYIAVLADGNTFFCWTKNLYYPESTIVNLKAELRGNTRQPTLEERVAILEARLDRLSKDK